jgi:hypothetical protein
MPVQLREENEGQRLTVLFQDPEAIKALTDLEGIRVFKTPRREVAERARNLFVFAVASALEQVAEFVTTANRRHELRVLFVREDVDSRWLPQMFDRANLRTLRNTLVHANASVEPKRVLNAWRHGGEHNLIAGASALADKLMVLSCALDKYEVAFDDIPALKRIARTERRHFTIADDGSYIHWPVDDIHLDIEAFRIAVDPAYREEAFGRRAVHDRRYGAAIAALRQRVGLRQSDIDGLSDRQVRRIEGGDRTSVHALRLLAAAHRMDFSEYLDELARTVSGHAAAEQPGRERIAAG